MRSRASAPTCGPFPWVSTDKGVVLVVVVVCGTHIAFVFCERERGVTLTQKRDDETILRSSPPFVLIHCSYLLTELVVLSKTSHRRCHL